MTEQQYQNATKIHNELDRLETAIEILQKNLTVREVMLNGVELPLNNTEFDTFRKNALESIRARRDKLISMFAKL